MIAAWAGRYAPATLHTKRKILGHMLGWFEEIGGPPGLSRQLRKIRQPAPRVIIASPEEIAALYAFASGWQRFLITLALTHGLRRAEALRLCTAHYNAQDQTIAVPTKGNQVHSFLACREVRDTIALLAGQDRNTPVAELLRGRPLSKHVMHQSWDELRHRAGVNPKLRFHDLRRTCAVNIYRETRDLREVQQVLGHKQLLTTCVYLAHVDPKNIRPVIDQMRAEAKRSFLQ